MILKLDLQDEGSIVIIVPNNFSTNDKKFIIEFWFGHVQYIYLNESN